VQVRYVSIISHRFVDYQIDTDHEVAIYALSASTKLVQIEMAITQPNPPPQDNYLMPIENSLEFLSLTNFSLWVPASVT